MIFHIPISIGSDLLGRPSPSPFLAPDPLQPQSILGLVLKSGATLCALQRAQYAPEEGQGILGWWTKNSQYDFPSLAHVLSHNCCMPLALQTAVRAPRSHKPGCHHSQSAALRQSLRSGKSSAHNLHHKLVAVTATSLHLQHMLVNRIGASLGTFSTTVSPLTSYVVLIAAGIKQECEY